MWPARFDFNKNECRGYLRRLELESYSNMLNTVRAQGGLSDAKIKMLKELRDILHISIERHRAEIRRVANDEHLCTIADVLTGTNTAPEWNKEGRRTFPFLPRSAPTTALSIVANDSADVTNAFNEQLANTANGKITSNLFTETTGNSVITKDPLESKLNKIDAKKSPQQPIKWPRNKNKFLQANTQNPLNKKIHQLYLRHTKSRLTNRKVYTKRGLGKTKAAQNNPADVVAAKTTNSPAPNYKRPAKPLKKTKKIKRTTNSGGKTTSKATTATTITAAAPVPVASAPNLKHPPTKIGVNTFPIDATIHNDQNSVVKIVYASQADGEQSTVSSAFQSNNSLITESTPVIALYPESDGSIGGQNYDFSKMRFSTLDLNDASEKNNFIVINQSAIGGNAVDSFPTKNIINLPSIESIHSISTEHVEIPIQSTPAPPSLVQPPKITSKPSIVLGKHLMGTKPTNLGKITLASFQSKGNVRIIKSPDGKVILKASDDFNKTNANVTNMLKGGSLKNMQIFTKTSKSNLVLMPKIYQTQAKTKNLVFSQSTTTMQPVQSELSSSNKVNIIDSKIIDTNIQIPFVVQSTTDGDTKILTKRTKIEPLTTGNVSIKIDPSFSRTTDKVISIKGNLPIMKSTNHIQAIATPANIIAETTCLEIQANRNGETINKTDWENELDQTTAPNKISTGQFIDRDDMIMDDDIVSDYIMEDDEMDEEDDGHDQQHHEEEEAEEEL